MSEGPGTVRVATWNIRGGVGSDGRYDLARVVRLIKHAEPDIVALQEVDSRRATAPHEHPFIALRQALGDHCVEARTLFVAEIWPFIQGLISYSTPK